jgi:hypothetical protein
MHPFENAPTDNHRCDIERWSDTVAFLASIVERVSLIVLHALGQCLIRTAVTTITPRADMCFALASYLTRERGKRFPRRTIERFFWPAMRPVDASHSLSGLIHKLRDRGVLIERDEASCIWLPREAAAMDVESVATEPLSHLAERDLSILPGYSPRASADYRDWVDEWREDIRIHLLVDVIAATSQATTARNWPLALALARQALTLDSSNEHALVARARAAAQLAHDERPISGTIGRGETSELPAIRLRETATVAGWSARPVLSATSGDTPLVGRAAPMRRLRSKAVRVAQGKVCSTYISAPAGIGKSRLVRELTAHMRESGAAVCIVPCERPDVHRPLSAFIQAVPRLQALPGAAGCAPTSVACLARVTQSSSDEPAISVSDDSGYLSESIRASVIDLIDAVADEQPLLLVVEDVHWIDPASWSLLRTIAEKAQRSVFLICTSRVAWKHSTWGPPEYFRLEELPALDASAARSHVLNYLERVDRTAEDEYIAWCVETSNGNPYFIEELVNYWVSTDEQYSAPPSLIAVTSARLARVQPESLRVIQAAAVLGKNSTVELLQLVLELPTHTLFSSIEELGQAGLLTVPGAEEDSATAPVLCRHELIIRAATKGLSAQGRALLHHAAARAMESAATNSQSAELLWDCADHWHAAGQSERSIRAAVVCARHLHDMGLVHDAVKRCEAALAMSQTDAGRSAILRAMAQSQYAARDWQAFCQTAAQVRALENTSTIPSPIHDDLELCELNAQRNLHRDWNGALESTLRCVRSTGADAAHRVQAAISTFAVATNVGDSRTMDAVFKLVDPLLYCVGVGAQDRLMFTMIYHTIREDAETSATSARELLGVAERNLPPRHRMAVMLNCASALRRHGVSGEAETLCESLFHTAIPLGAFDFAADACNRLIEMHIDSGDIDSAVRWAASYSVLRRPKAELRSHRTLRIAMARLCASKGEWSRARKLLGSSRGNRLWEDTVAMLRSAALATKIRLDIGEGASASLLARRVRELALLGSSLRTMGAQDYESYSVYLGYQAIGETATAERFFKTYVSEERRDLRPPSPEITAEIERLAL